jgi:hypothetical protein
LFSPGTAISSSYKTDRHDINEILLKVALNTIILSQHLGNKNSTPNQIKMMKISEMNRLSAELE